MAIIVYRRKTIFGKERLLPEYLPSGTVPTPEIQQTAKALDAAIKKSVQSINEEYATNKKIKESKIEKWKWLGEKLASLIKSLENLEKADFDNNSIWPAISQYLHPDLTRGFDTKRSGTTKDHLRKVWLLATLPNTDWFNNWIGWDAFVDRGEPLVRDSRVLKHLKRVFPDKSGKLGKDDYQKIARLLVEYLSSRRGNAMNFGLLTDQEIEQAVEKVKSKILSANKK